MTFLQMYYEHVDQGAMMSHIRSMNVAARALERPAPSEKSDCNVSQMSETSEIEEVKEEEEQDGKSRISPSDSSRDYRGRELRESVADYKPSRQSVAGMAPNKQIQGTQSVSNAKKQKSFKVTRRSSHRKTYSDMLPMAQFYKSDTSMLGDISDNDLSVERAIPPGDDESANETVVFSPKSSLMPIDDRFEPKQGAPHHLQSNKNSLIIDRKSAIYRDKERKSSSGFSHHAPQIYPNVQILSVFLDKRLLISTDNFLYRSNSQHQHIRKKSFGLLNNSEGAPSDMGDFDHEKQDMLQSLKLPEANKGGDLSGDERGRSKAHSVVAPGTIQIPRSKSISQIAEAQFNAQEAQENEMIEEALTPRAPVRMNNSRANLQSIGKKQTQGFTEAAEEDDEILLEKQFTPVEIVVSKSKTALQSGKLKVKQLFGASPGQSRPSSPEYSTRKRAQSPVPIPKQDEPYVDLSEEESPDHLRIGQNLNTSYLTNPSVSGAQSDNSHVSGQGEKKSFLKRKVFKKLRMNNKTSFKSVAGVVVKTKKAARKPSRHGLTSARSNYSTSFKSDIGRNDLFSEEESDLDELATKTLHTFKKIQDIPAAPPSSSGTLPKKDDNHKEKNYGRSSTQYSNKSHARVSIDPPISLAQEFTPLGQLCVFYASNLALQEFSKDALRVIEIGLKVNEIICRANLIKLRGLIKMQSEPRDFWGAKNDFQLAFDEFQRGHSLHGAAICKAALGYLFQNKLSNGEHSKKAKRYLEEALQLYIKQEHYVGQAYCYYNLALIIKSADRQKAKEYEQKQWNAQRKARKGNFIHRWQGRQVSLFVQVATSHKEISAQINRPSKPHSLTTKPAQINRKSQEQRKSQFSSETNQLARNFLRRYKATKYDLSGVARGSKRDKSLIERMTDASKELSESMLPKWKILTEKGGQIYTNIKNQLLADNDFMSARAQISKNPPDMEVAGISTLAPKRKKTQKTDTDKTDSSKSSLREVNKRKASDASHSHSNHRNTKVKKKAKPSWTDAFTSTTKSFWSRDGDDSDRTPKTPGASAFSQILSPSSRRQIQAYGIKTITEAYKGSSVQGTLKNLSKFATDKLKKLRDTSKERKDSQKRIQKSTRNAKVKVSSLQALKGGIKVGTSISDSQILQK